jgi:hypothetical protein
MNRNRLAGKKDVRPGTRSEDTADRLIAQGVKHKSRSLTVCIEVRPKIDVAVVFDGHRAMILNGWLESAAQ